MGFHGAGIVVVLFGSSWWSMFVGHSSQLHIRPPILL